MEAQDGGDSKNEVSPRDVVYTEPAEGGSPQVVAGTDLRFGYFLFYFLVPSTCFCLLVHPLASVVLLRGSGDLF